MEEKEYVLMERKRSAENLNLTYRLTATLAGERIGGYRVSVRLCDDEKRAYFSNLFEAVEFFSKIVEGLVTPCSFQDVVSDLFESWKI